uniref:Uncharacterized protein n=1 Tax=Fervidobacterium pennivorans TaxID=93466 RepID=A0A7C4W742_FERPE
MPTPLLFIKKGAGMEYIRRLRAGASVVRSIVSGIRGFWRDIFSPYVTFPTREELEELFIPKIVVPEVERLRQEFIVRRLLQDIIETRPHIYDFKTSRWIYSYPVTRPEDIRVTKGSWIAVDVVLRGPDGQLIRVIDLKMPPGRPWDREVFFKRLAAELARKSEKGEIQPIYQASAYLAASLVDYVAYKVTREVKPKGRR